MPWYDRFRASGGQRHQIEELTARVQELSEQRSIDFLPWNTGANVPSSTPTSERALRLAPVYAAVSLIARSISTLPMHAYRKTGDDRVRMPYLPQLFQTPSIHGDITDWLHRLLVSLLLDGNAYGLITSRDGHQYPTTIEWLNPRQMYVVDEGQWGRGSYWDPIYYWRGREVDPAQLVHIPWFSQPFRVKGLTPLGAFAASVDIGLAGQDFVSDWYDGGGQAVGTFKNSAQKVTEPESKVIKARLVDAIRSHQPIVYGNDWDYKPITINPKDSIFVETHQMSATDIAAVYGIYPPERIGGVTKSNMTYTNVEQEQIQFTQLTLLPYVRKLESVFFDLLPQPQFVKLDLDSQIRTDTHTRYLVHQIARDIGLKNIDEIRDVEDMPHLPNGAGQDYNPLVAVRELIRSAAASPLNPNLPGFQAGEPGVAPGIGSPPGAAPPPPAPPVNGTQPVANGAAAVPVNGRFTAGTGELVPVAAQSSSAASAEGDQIDAGF